MAHPLVEAMSKTKDAYRVDIKVIDDLRRLFCDPVYAYQVIVDASDRITLPEAVERLVEIAIPNDGVLVYEFWLSVARKFYNWTGSSRQGAVTKARCGRLIYEIPYLILEILGGDIDVNRLMSRAAAPFYHDSRKLRQLVLKPDATNEAYEAETAKSMSDRVEEYVRASLLLPPTAYADLEKPVPPPAGQKAQMQAATGKVQKALNPTAVHRPPGALEEAKVEPMEEAKSAEASSVPGPEPEASDMPIDSTESPPPANTTGKPGIFTHTNPAVSAQNQSKGKKNTPSQAPSQATGIAMPATGEIANAAPKPRSSTIERHPIMNIDATPVNRQPVNSKERTEFEARIAEAERKFKASQQKREEERNTHNALAEMHRSLTRKYEEAEAKLKELSYNAATAAASAPGTVTMSHESFQKQASELSLAKVEVEKLKNKLELMKTTLETQLGVLKEANDRQSAELKDTKDTLKGYTDRYGELTLKYGNLAEKLTLSERALDLKTVEYEGIAAEMARLKTRLEAVKSVEDMVKAQANELAEAARIDVPEPIDITKATTSAKIADLEEKLKEAKELANKLQMAAVSTESLGTAATEAAKDLIAKIAKAGVEIENENPTNLNETLAYLNKVISAVPYAILQKNAHYEKLLKDEKEAYDKLKGSHAKLVADYASLARPTDTLFQQNEELKASVAALKQQLEEKGAVVNLSLATQVVEHAKTIENLTGDLDKKINELAEREAFVETLKTKLANTVADNINFQTEAFKAGKQLTEARTKLSKLEEILSKQGHEDILGHLIDPPADVKEKQKEDIRYMQSEISRLEEELVSRDESYQHDLDELNGTIAALQAAAKVTDAEMARLVSEGQRREMDNPVPVVEPIDMLDEEEIPDLAQFRHVKDELERANAAIGVLNGELYMKGQEIVNEQLRVKELEDKIEESANLLKHNTAMSEESLKSLRQEFIEGKKKNDELANAQQVAIADMQAEIQQLSANLEESMNERQAILEAHNSIQATLSDASTYISGLEVTQGNLQAALQERMVSLQALHEQAQRVTMSEQQAKQTNLMYENAITSMRNELNARAGFEKQVIEQKETMIRDYQFKLDKLQSEMTIKEQLAQSKEAIRLSLESNLAQMSADLKIATTQLSMKSEEAATLRGKVAMLESDLYNSSEKISALQAKTSTQIAALKAEISTLGQSATKGKSDKAALDRLTKRYEGELSALKAEMLNYSQERDYYKRGIESIASLQPFFNLGLGADTEGLVNAINEHISDLSIQLQGVQHTLHIRNQDLSKKYAECDAIKATVIESTKELIKRTPAYSVVEASATSLSLTQKSILSMRAKIASMASSSEPDILSQLVNVYSLVELQEVDMENLTRSLADRQAREAAISTTSVSDVLKALTAMEERNWEQSAMTKKTLISGFNEHGSMLVSGVYQYMKQQLDNSKKAENLLEIRVSSYEATISQLENTLNEAGAIRASLELTISQQHEKLKASAEVMVAYSEVLQSISSALPSVVVDNSIPHDVQEESAALTAKIIDIAKEESPAKILNYIGDVKGVLRKIALHNDEKFYELRQDSVVKQQLLETNLSIVSRQKEDIEHYGAEVEELSSKLQRSITDYNNMTITVRQLEGQLQMGDDKNKSEGLHYQAELADRKKDTETLAAEIQELTLTLQAKNAQITSTETDLQNGVALVRTLQEQVEFLQLQLDAKEDERLHAIVALDVSESHLSEALKNQQAPKVNTQEQLAIQENLKVLKDEIDALHRIRQAIPTKLKESTTSVATMTEILRQGVSVQTDVVAKVEKDYTKTKSIETQAAQTTNELTLQKVAATEIKSKNTGYSRETGEVYRQELLASATTSTTNPETAPLLTQQLKTVMEWNAETAGYLINAGVIEVDNQQEMVEGLKTNPRLGLYLLDVCAVTEDLEYTDQELAWFYMFANEDVPIVISDPSVTESLKVLKDANINLQETASVATPLMPTEALAVPAESTFLQKLPADAGTDLAKSKIVPKITAPESVESLRSLCSKLARSPKTQEASPVKPTYTGVRAHAVELMSKHMSREEAEYVFDNMVEKKLLEEMVMSGGGRPAISKAETRKLELKKNIVKGGPRDVAKSARGHNRVRMKSRAYKIDRAALGADMFAMHQRIATA